MAPGAVPPPPAVDDARPAVAPLPCPRCAQPLEPRSARCGACDLPLTGLVAASLWRVDQRIAALHRQRAELLAQLVASEAASAVPGAVLGDAPSAVPSDAPSAVPGAVPGDASSEAPTGEEAPAGPTGVDGPGGAAPGGAAPRSVDRVPGGPDGAQRVLLVAGVVLVTASALGLGALAVTRLGALGQLAVLALLVAGALAASRWSLARRLTASGESFAVLAVALVTTGAGAVRSQDVIGADVVPDRAWPLVVMAGLCVMSAAAASLLRRDGRPMAFGWAALSTGTLVPSALAVLLDVGAPGLAAVMLGAAALLPLAASTLRGHGPVARAAVLVVAALHLVVGSLVGAGALLDVPAPAEALVVSGALAALAAAALAWGRAARRGQGPSPLVGVARSLSPVTPAVAWSGGGAAVVAAAGGGDVLVVTGTVLALAAAAVLVARSPLPRAAPLTALVAAAACLLLEPAQRSLFLLPPVPPLPAAPAWAGWAAVSLAAAATALLPPAPRSPGVRARTAAPSSAVPSTSASPVWMVVSGVAAVTAALTTDSGDVLVVTGIVLALAAAAVLVGRALLPRVVSSTALAAAAACLLLEALQRAVLPVPDLPAAPVWAGWAAVSLAAAATALLPPAPQVHGVRARTAALRWAVPSTPAALVWTAVSGVAAVTAALTVPAGLPSPLGEDPRVGALAVVATAALALGAAHRSWAAGPVGAGAEGVLVGVWAAALGLATLVAYAGPLNGPVGAPTAVRAVLALAGAQALLHGLLPGRTGFRVIGVLVLSWAWWLTVGDVVGSEPAVEAWSLPPAALALGVGAATWRRLPALPSWVALGPGLVAGLAPSAVWAATVDAPGAGGTWVRPTVVVLVAVVVAAAGTRLSWQAPLVVGAAAAVLVASSQLGPYVARAPLWLTTGLAGVAVLALAVRLEVARRSSARALSWVAALR